MSCHIDALIYATTFTHNIMNRQLTETDPLNRTHYASYDADGRVASTTDAKGQTIIYNYDNANRLTSKKYPDNSTETYTYDNNGNLLRAVNPAVSMAYTYDKRNALLSIKNETINKTVGYSYDVNGRKISLTYPDGEAISYTRDPHGQVSTLSTSQPGTLANPIASYNYTPSRMLSSIEYSFGMHVTRTYDPVTGRLTDLKYTKPDNSVISDFVYTHDTAGNILTKTNDFGTITYTYDPLNRLTGAAYNWKPVEAFTYDAVGNRLTSADYNNWQYDSANQLLNYGNSSINAFTFTYDANGSTTSKTETVTNQTTNYIYNFDNRISEVQQNSSTFAKYYYDYQSQRVRKELYSGGALSSVTWSVYGQEGLLVEYDNTGQLIKKYAWQPDQLWGTDPFFQQDSLGNRAFHINDHIHTSQKMLSIDYTPIWLGDWLVFGYVDSTIQGIINLMRFPGQISDTETVYYNRYRYYDSQIARYYSVDPTGFRGGVNQYIYSFQNPVIFYDNTGLSVPCNCKAQDPCKSAKEEGLLLKLPSGTRGTVVCCDNEKYACAYVGDFPGAESVRKCVIDHEKNHLHDAVCPTGKGLEIADTTNFSPQANEVIEHMESVKCLKEQQSKFKPGSLEWDNIQYYIDGTQATIDKLTGIKKKRSK